MTSNGKKHTRRVQLGQGCHWAAALPLVAAAAVAHPHRWPSHQSPQNRWHLRLV